MTNMVRNEIDRCEKRANTLRLLDTYLRNHVGESFTCRDLREKTGVPVNSNMMAQWLRLYADVFGVKVSVSETTVSCNPPIKLNTWDGRVTYLESYEVNLYSVEALDDSWESMEA